MQLHTRGPVLLGPLQLLLWLIIRITLFDSEIYVLEVDLKVHLRCVGPLFQSLFVLSDIPFFGAAADLSCLIFFTVSAHGQFSWELVY